MARPRHRRICRIRRARAFASRSAHVARGLGRLRCSQSHPLAPRPHSTHALPSFAPQPLDVTPVSPPSPRQVDAAMSADGTVPATNGAAIGPQVTIRARAALLSTLLFWGHLYTTSLTYPTPPHTPHPRPRCAYAVATRLHFSLPSRHSPFGYWFRRSRASPSRPLALSPHARISLASALHRNCIRLASVLHRTVASHA